MKIHEPRDDFESSCRECLSQYFGKFPDAATEKRAMKALRLLAACDEPLLGKPTGWAAGIIYSLVNRGRIGCGFPKLLNAEAEKFFGVSMGTIRKRAARVEERLTI